LSFNFIFIFQWTSNHILPRDIIKDVHKPDKGFRTFFPFVTWNVRFISVRDSWYKYTHYKSAYERGYLGGNEQTLLSGFQQAFLKLRRACALMK
jgi:hypothetical protein